MKVAIVGAGICGLYLAWKLAERGHEVIVFEKREKIGKEICSGLFSERILDFIPESKNLIQNEINYCLIHFPKRTLKIKFSKKFFVMEHYKLDRLVASFVENTGAKIILNQKISSIPVGFEKIIGCDGAKSLLRKNLNLKDPYFYLGIQGFISTPLLKNSGGGVVETWPTRSGFIWKIPRGKEIEYGIIEKPKDARKTFEEFLKKNNLNLERKNSTLIPQGLIIPSNPKITLCGDASGLTKPWSGGGVVWGLMAADILLRTFPDFLKYKREIRKFFLPKIIFSKLIKKLVYFLGFNFPWFLPKNIKIEGDFLGRS